MQKVQNAVKPLNMLRLMYSILYSIAIHWPWPARPLKQDRDSVEHPVTCTLTVGSSIRATRNGSLLAVGAPALVAFGILREAWASSRDCSAVTSRSGVRAPA